ncbi:ABC transporter permease [Wenjunlia tyrosinilytica]|uniref:Sulfate ABC transporter permease n=1 Tax=Wenjunlia tyrosinilytica TaxID=1544741 RepID=A0A917ZVF8_9ACTN|nr:ABC transporter permease [Wenjunlia tyrosinilytica]GGO92266.1 sulfate ABC transporter permease [Wenjunlia tyrosinilytica]
MASTDTGRSAGVTTDGQDAEKTGAAGLEDAGFKDAGFKDAGLEGSAVADAGLEDTQATHGSAGDRPVGDDLGGLEAGLDALETQAQSRVPLGTILLHKVLPPVVAVVLVLGVWQILAAADVKPDYMLPSPLDVWHSLSDQWHKGTLLGVVWQSLSRGALGFLASLAIGTPLGLLVARVPFVRAAIGPILSGLQSLPSVAWVPAAIIWFGLNDSTIYAVVLLGAVPSIANGLVSGVDQVPPLFLRAGRTLGAAGLSGIRHVLLPAALPGYLAGLKQGWAFSWRSLMAAELITHSPDLGVGLGQQLENARGNSDMPGVLAAILLILVVGIGIELLVFSPIERRVLRSRGLIARSL